jgi:hypothetical protein
MPDLVVVHHVGLPYVETGKFSLFYISFLNVPNPPVRINTGTDGLVFGSLGRQNFPKPLLHWWGLVVEIALFLIAFE